ncbi:hypothetical protein [Photobacterium nomapromontoriensis]|uniref:hypothetical protein n=1 Tax=Photobacterium nomapromontoriensis TaxID=2910237 RepID=UPI003D0A1613
MNNSLTVSQYDAQLKQLIAGITTHNTEKQQANTYTNDIENYTQKLGKQSSLVEEDFTALLTKNSMPMAAGILGKHYLTSHQMDDFNQAYPDTFEQHQATRKLMNQSSLDAKTAHTALEDAKQALNNAEKAIVATRRKLQVQADNEALAKKKAEEEAIQKAALRKKALIKKLTLTTLFMGAVAAFVTLQLR